MIGDEARVVDAFCAWLASQGWSIEREIDHVDILAARDGIRLYAEAKGRTSSPGLDVDTLYGQLLRRMPSVPSDDRLFAVVVPVEAASAASRVPLWVRERLAITVYTVDPEGTVQEMHG